MGLRAGAYRRSPDEPYKLTDRAKVGYTVGIVGAGVVVVNVLGMVLRWVLTEKYK